MINDYFDSMSLPARGAWIEILKPAYFISGASSSFPARGAWIEMTWDGVTVIDGDKSLPARGAWIEIFVKSFYLW